MSLLIVYNASGTLLGHLAYGYHHIRSTPDKECSACALTHGPSLSLSEREEWASLKERLERGCLKGLEGKKVLVKQLHTEDISQETRQYMSGQNLALPCVLLQTSPAHLQTVFSKSDLDAFNGDLTRFTDALSDRLARLI